MYDYRKLTWEQKREIIEYRQKQNRPLHSPPHWEFQGQRQFIISAACYEHAPVMGKTLSRMTECETALLTTCEKYVTAIYAWCILPNHYHLLIQTDNVKILR